MEISERELRAAVCAVDDVHREGMQHARADIAELHFGEGRRLMAMSRRTVLRRGAVAGTAVAVGSQLVPMTRLFTPAFAQSLDDATIAAFAESVELAAVAAYEAAAGSGKVTTPAVVEAATMFAGHHSEHGAAFGGAAGDKATGMANAALLAELGPQLEAAPDEAAILELAYTVENAAAATYMFALGALTTAAALQLTASILPVESQHAVVLGQVLGKPATEFIPSFETDTAAIKPDKYPLG
jgi:hypothetical protein